MSNAETITSDLTRSTDIDPGRMAELHNRLAAAAQRDGVLDVAYRTVDDDAGNPRA